MYVEVRDVNKSFGDFKALEGISFGVEQGELVALLGPSGSGKTTILRAIAGLESADTGDILIDGHTVNDVPGSQRGIGFVFQSYALFRYMTVADNIAFGLRVQKRDKAYIRKRVAELIELVGLSGMAKRYPNQLSGGQRQRVAFARALAPEPKVLLLDEPFAAIDAKVRQELRQWLRGMITQLGITSIFVTHDQDEALEVSDRIIVMDRGRIEQIGTPLQIYTSPQTAFVARFAGNSPVVEGFGVLKGFEQETDAQKAVIRPEFVDAFKPDNQRFAKVLDATEDAVVSGIFFRGDHYEVTLRIGKIEVTTRRNLERRTIEVGEHLRVLIHRLYVVEGDRIATQENRLLDASLILDD